MEQKIYLVFIHLENGNLRYGGIFDTRDKAQNVCNEWNDRYKDKNHFADFINVTGEMNDEFILWCDCK